MKKKKKEVKISIHENKYIIEWLIIIMDIHILKFSYAISVIEQVIYN